MDETTDLHVALPSPRVAAEMRAYVADLADASGELVAETEAHTVERLLREAEW